MKKMLLVMIITLCLSGQAFAQEDGRSKCLESTVLFYNCVKSGTELQRNLTTTYLLGALQTLDALGLVLPPKDKTMAHFKFEYLDYIEAHGSIHQERPGKSVIMYMLETYGDKENSKGMEYVKGMGLIP